MAEFLKSLAENLAAHMPAIDTSDAHGRTEWAAYERLSKEYEALAARLAKTAMQMQDCRELPAARHHEEELADPRLLEAFSRFVALEAELAEILAASAEQDGRLLQDSRAADE